METDPLAQNIIGVQDLVESRTNKVESGVFGNDEGVESERIDVLSLDLDDEELLALRDRWEVKYAPYEARYKIKYERNKRYYLGNSDGQDANEPLAANLLFEAEETFLPAALSKNPEPVVYSDNSDEGNKLADDVKTMLQFHADQLVLRRKLALMVRQWSIYHLGVLKHGWNKEINDISTEVRKIQDFIFDPDGFVDSYGDFSSWLGERITVSADRLIELFPDHKAYITIMVDGKMGTDVTYTEWWTDEYCFSTYKEIVLDKHKNEFFKYATKEDDEYGVPTDMPGRNHFAAAKKPYTFLSVFSLAEQPHDITGLIEQNIPNQNLVTKRTYQIDKNLSRSNNSIAFSQDNFNQETAKQAAGAFDKGNPVLVPAGRPIGEAIIRFPADGFPDAAYKELEGNKLQLRQIFGTEGITAQPQNDDTTARGMILNQQYDNTRIGGGIGDAIEQVADNVFNWWVQLYYVYYDEQHFASVMGQMKATEYVILSAQNLTRQLIVSVSPDSMKPKDEVTTMNQAQELYQMGAIGPVTLLTILNFPDPKQAAADGALWVVDKGAYLQLNFPDLAAQLQQMQQQQMAMQQAAQAQEMQAQGANTQMELGQKEATHQQKLRHGEEAHQAKMKLQQVPETNPKKNLSSEPANASLSQVKLPK